MKSRMSCIAITGVFLLAPLLAGCLGGTKTCYPTDCDLNHILLLHDITYEWNEEEKELSGHFILSNLHPDPSDTDKEVWMKVLLIRGRFTQDDVDRGPERNTWSLGYDDYQKITIRPGDSMVFNYTFPKQVTYRNNSIDWTPDEVELHLLSSYVYYDPDNVREENPDGAMQIEFSYQNWCLGVVDAEVVQDDAGDCSPWRDYWDRHTGWYYKVGNFFFPPPEMWPTWNNNSPVPLSTYPQFRKHVEFLQDFDYESANIVYFEGEIR